MNRTVVVLLSLIAPPLLAPAASATSLSGIEASGGGSHFFKVCSTCPTDGECG
jgi:hypothetical protein